LFLFGRAFAMAPAPAGALPTFCMRSSFQWKNREAPSGVLPNTPRCPEKGSNAREKKPLVSR